jgi:asparagine synthase (glutamine-hydrolysing)
MCGISGIVTRDPQQPVDRALLEHITDLLVHRGPDGRGFHVAPGVGLGMRRLSIVDLETGDQPISNESGTVHLVCNGEIYNAPELREELLARGHTLRGHSDVEVIVHLYEELGLGFLGRLRGMFALAIWDNAARTLHLARDRFGMKPLYYGQASNGSLVFGSEIKSVLASGLLPRALDPAGLSDILAIGGPMFTRSAFRGVQQLEAGHSLSYHAGHITTTRYWDLDFSRAAPSALPRSEGEWAEAIAAKLRESVHIHLRGDVPVAAYLSPGIDSSIVTRFATDEMTAVMRTFSLGFTDPEYDELRTQRTLDAFPGQRLSGDRVAYHGTLLDHLPTAIWHEEQPVTLQYSWQALGAAMKGEYKVALTGQGSDEMFGGYPWHQADHKWRRLYALPGPVRRVMARHLPRISSNARRALAADPVMTIKRYFALRNPHWNSLMPLFQPALREAIERTQRELTLPGVPDGFEHWDRFQRFIYIEQRTRLPSYINRGLDASSMAQSIEPRLPFLDHEFVELCMHIPPALRYRRMEKHMLRRAAEPFLPAEIVWRKKRGLQSPSASWSAERGAPPAFAQELLSDEVVRAKGYFRADAVRALRDTQPRIAGALSAVLGVHLLDEMFVQGRGQLVETVSGQLSV